MRRFFETLYACLVRGARAVLQMYPEDASQVSQPPSFSPCRPQHDAICLLGTVLERVSILERVFRPLEAVSALRQHLAIRLCGCGIFHQLDVYVYLSSQK